MLVLKCLSLALVTLLAAAAVAAPGPVAPTKKWKGSIADGMLEALKPKGGAIGNAGDFKKLAEAWKIAEKVPEVDFDKELVLVATTVGSILNLGAALDDKGDLKVQAMSTFDFHPGFRYAVVSVPRAGVKSIDGQALPK